MPHHSERRRLPHSREQLFDLVADIERYPEFLPWCVGARIRTRTDNMVTADLMIGYRLLRERFTSRVTLKRPERIDVEYAEGPFEYLRNRWLFEAHPDGSCTVDFDVDFRFKSRVFERLIGAVFHEAVRRMVRAFETRADALYATDDPDLAERCAFGPAR